MLLDHVMKNNKCSFHFPPDESLQSFLFRILKVNGYINYSSVLVPNSGWGGRPSIPFEAKDILIGVTKSQLLKLLEKNTLISKEESDFVNHFDYVQLFDKTFSPKKYTKSAGKGMNIHFCPLCMRAQMYQYGYSYFKRDWNNHLYCLKHSERLLALKPSNMSLMIININKILKCEVDNSFTFIPEYNQSHFMTASDRSVKFAPCAKKQLIYWVIKNSKYYPQGYTDICDYGLLDPIAKKAFNSKRYRYEIESDWDRFYQQITEYAHKDLTDYIQKHMVFDFTQFRDKGIISDHKVILKNKYKSCQACQKFTYDNYKACSKNTLFYNPKTIHEPNNGYKESFDYKYRKLEVDIQRHQNQLGIRQGEAQVRREIKMSYEYKRLGGKENYMKILKKAVYTL